MPAVPEINYDYPNGSARGSYSDCVEFSDLGNPKEKFKQLKYYAASANRFITTMSDHASLNYPGCWLRSIAGDQTSYTGVLYSANGGVPDTGNIIHSYGVNTPYSGVILPMFVI